MADEQARPLTAAQIEEVRHEVEQGAAGMSPTAETGRLFRRLLATLDAMAAQSEQRARRITELEAFMRVAARPRIVALQAFVRRVAADPTVAPDLAHAASELLGEES